MYRNRHYLSFRGPGYLHCFSWPDFLLPGNGWERMGKKFKMYKFRSMYLDAEERKAELMKQNKLGDGKMFKMDFDPAKFIGNKVSPDGTHKKRELVILSEEPVWMSFHSFLMC